MPERLARGTSRSVRLCISIDTEEDNWGPVLAGITTQNILELPKLSSLFRRLGVRPTYFTTYQVAVSPDAAAVMRELAATGFSEIGAHLHPWNTPPAVGLEDRVSMLMRYPAEAQASKLDRLVAVLRSEVGVHPTAFRAGRFGFDASTIAALVDNGIRVDSSVTPLLSWEDEGGPAYLRAPNEPFHLLVSGDSPSESGLIEIPVTVGYTRFSPSSWGKLASLLHTTWARWLHVAGLASRVGLFRRVIVSPETNSAEEMLAVSRRLIANGATHLHMYFHSSSLLPGLTPFARSAADVNVIYDRIERFVDALHDVTDVTFCTVTESAELHSLVTLPAPNSFMLDSALQRT